MDAPACKMSFERSTFDANELKHKSFIERKAFNHKVSIVVPDFAKVPEEVTAVLEGEPYWIVRNLPLSWLVKAEFIKAFVQRGCIYMLSHKTHIDTENVFALTPTGELILNVDKDTYEQLGLEGRPSKFSKKRPRKFVIKIELTAPYFKPGKKYHDRVVWCLADRLNLKADFLVYWKPHDDKICPSSLCSYLVSEGFSCSLHRQHRQTSQSTGPSQPVVQWASTDDSVDSCGFMALWEWLGAQTIGATNGEADDYVSTMTCPAPQIAMETCAVCSYSGFILPHQIHALLDRCRQHLEESKGKWMAFTVHGFADSPISWSGWEHGYQNCGDNLYTYIIFPHGSYWLYTASDTHDKTH